MRYLFLALLLLSMATTGACGGKSKEEQASEAVSRGLQAHFEGNLDEAAKQYLQALDADPSDKYALFNLGVIEQGKERVAGAESYYRLALRADPDFPPALFNLAIIRSEAGAPGEAATLYQRAVAAEPSNAAAHLNLGFALNDAGQPAEARTAWKRAVDLNPALAARVPTEAPSSESRPDSDSESR